MAEIAQLIEHAIYNCVKKTNENQVNQLIVINLMDKLSLKLFFTT